MPAPFKVELAAHDPRWAEATKAESEALGAALGPTILVVHLHHIGSASSPVG